MELRKLEQSDIALVSEWLAGDHIAAFLGDTDEWLEELKDNLSDAKWISYFICEEKGVPVGFVQYYDPERVPVGVWSGAPKFSLGIDFFVGRPVDLGKGIATRMVALLKKKLSHEGMCRFLVADPDKTDKASVRVLEKNGFRLQPSGLYIAAINS